MFRMLSVFLISLFFLPAVCTANIDQLSNMSVEWLRTGNRNAATDSTDIVVYNPAGIVRMSDGFHLNFSNQSMIREPGHRYDLGFGQGERESEQDSPDWLIPSFFGAYKKDRWAIFGGVYIPGGGAVADYPEGSINTQFIGNMNTLVSGGELTGFRNDRLEASSVYLATALGGVYSITDQISLALGVRYLYAKNEAEAGADFIDSNGNIREYILDYDDTADGFGGILGLNFAPRKDLNIGLCYETQVDLDFETGVNRNDFPEFFELAEDQAESPRDFPARFGIGAAYDITPALKAEVDFGWYFQKQADWGETADGRSLSDAAGDAWSMGAALSYQFSPDLLFSCGTVFTKFEWEDINAYYETIGAFEVLYSDNWYIGGGLAWEFVEGIKFNIAVGVTLWEDESIRYNQASNLGLGDIDVETENRTYNFAFGFDASF